MGKETGFEKRNGREIGNKTEFNTRNRRKWETRQDKMHNFSTKNEKNRGKNWRKKTGEKQKITRNTETRF